LTEIHRRADEEVSMKGGLFKTEKGLAVSLITTVLMFLAAAAYAETDVTNMVKVTYSNAVYDRVRKTTSYDVTLTNISTQTVFTPLTVIIDSVTPSTITVANADGTTTDGKPYFDYSSSVSSGKLEQNNTSTVKKWIFNNPQRLRFALNTKTMGVILVPTLTLDDLVNNLTEIISTGSTSGLAAMSIGDQPAQTFCALDSQERELIAASLLERGILLPEGIDLNAADEVWGRICLDDPEEGLICSPVLLKKDADGNWKVAQW
jgi:hypothetical protein